MIGMGKRALLAAASAALAVAFLSAPASAADKKVFYLLSHGGPSDAFWIDWNAGATKACAQLNVTCKISFSGGDMAAQKEAFNSAHRRQARRHRHDLGAAGPVEGRGGGRQGRRAFRSSSSIPTIRRPAARPMSARI